jgi:hypothetical protein
LSLGFGCCACICDMEKTKIINRIAFISMEMACLLIYY